MRPFTKRELALIGRLFGLGLSATFAAAADTKSIQSAFLDDRAVYSVPVSTNRVTTISFPGPISAIDAAGVTTDPKVPGPFQLAHTRGSSFFSVRALIQNAAANLNVRWNKRTYVFELIESDKPLLSLILETRTEESAVAPVPELSPTRLLSLLDKAKAFSVLKKQYPGAMADVDFVTYAMHPAVTEFDDYQIRLEEGYRFNHEDTLVFRATLTNKTAQAIKYRPGSFTLRAGDRVYPQSVSDASGIIPASGESTVYFAITGTPDGGRNELSLKNTFSVLVERITTEKRETEPQQTAHQPAPKLSPGGILSLIAKAKAFPLLKRHHPEVVADIDFVTFAQRPSVTDCNDFEVRLDEVYRFNREHVLVFRVTLKSKTAQPITYKPANFTFRAGNRVYPQSVSEAPGVIPATGEVTAYFAVSGIPDGGRNELSQNTFSVLVARTTNEPPANSE